MILSRLANEYFKEGEDASLRDGYIKGIIVFVIGLSVSYFMASLLGSGEAGVFTAICFFGALIFAELNIRNEQTKK